MFGIGTVKSVLQILQSEESPLQVAGGVAMGCLLGFSPASGPQNLLFFLIVMFSKVNIGAATLSTALFALVALALDPLANRIGYALLVQAEGLTPLWTALYNTPLVPFTRFNNTVVLGSLVIALALFIPLLFGTRALVVFYRARYKAKVDQLGFMKWVNRLTQATNLVDKVK